MDDRPHIATQEATRLSWVGGENLGRGSIFTFNASDQVILRTAAPSLTIPQSLLLQAEEVIQ